MSHLGHIYFEIGDVHIHRTRRCQVARRVSTSAQRFCSSLRASSTPQTCEAAHLRLPAAIPYAEFKGSNDHPQLKSSAGQAAFGSVMIGDMMISGYFTGNRIGATHWSKRNVRLLTVSASGSSSGEWHGLRLMCAKVMLRSFAMWSVHSQARNENRQRAPCCANILATPKRWG